MVIIKLDFVSKMQLQNIYYYYRYYLYYYRYHHNHNHYRHNYVRGICS